MFELQVCGLVEHLAHLPIGDFANASVVEFQPVPSVHVLCVGEVVAALPVAAVQQDGVTLVLVFLRILGSTGGGVAHRGVDQVCEIECAGKYHVVVEFDSLHGAPVHCETLQLQVEKVWHSLTPHKPRAFQMGCLGIANVAAKAVQLLRRAVRANRVQERGLVFHLQNEIEVGYTSTAHLVALLTVHVIVLQAVVQLLDSSREG